ncbi:class I adenylate-forming enzyme family protein [Jeotgalibacillus proteolyticus]|uniref:Long-chain fatty acid--CoA ligase n=1 Tax=Jeotgalibacillus proteolyticus TaxID=2082395 RepID=A0A2S5G778_9BACL|nr:fatty acid--CoA ligase family protein [Jeotgalibacillus proteolyticus]PPA68707.1 hypothetical protein C4B60_19245 [Jeotgalibacillus proteolyticus]PPA68784.1 hypothetical protein C4B60_19675 [Jeotgalibacillus proteolyticus]
MIIEEIKESSELYNKRPAIRYGNQTYSYSQMWEEIERHEKILNMKLSSKGPVGIQMKNHPTYIFIYYALIKAGSIPMLIDYTFTDTEVNTLCEKYSINYVIKLGLGDQIIFKEFKVESIEDNNDLKNTMTCRFSSGTTGVPKCLMFTESAVLNAGRNWAEASSLIKEDKILCTASFHNGLAFNTSFISTFLSGACIIICKKILTPKYIWKVIEEENVSIITAFPFVYDSLLSTSYQPKIKNLRLCLSSSAPLHNSTKSEFKIRFHLPICDYYGIVEAGPATFNDGTIPNSLGKLIEGVSVRIINESGKLCRDGEKGIIQIKSTSMSTGYYKDLNKFNSLLTEDGYYHTYDIAEMRKGFLYVYGRQDDSINVGGKKVDPVEIENVLKKHLDIRDAAVVGYKSPGSISEYPVAFYVTNNNVEKTDLIPLVKEQLASFKIPQKFVKINQIPRSGVGKVKRNLLLKELETMTLKEEKR